jgi:predicted transcriptional regulator
MSKVYKLTQQGRRNSSEIQRIDTKSDAIISYIKENGEATLEEIEHHIESPASSIMQHLVARRQVEEL